MVWLTSLLLINSLYQQQRSQHSHDTNLLTGNVWCDDHICVELDTGTCCMEANLALRRTMPVVLGPTAINEEKFTEWSTCIKALGLLCNTESGTVSVPEDKITKAQCRITELLTSDRCTLSTINKLLGSLRYVSMCFPAARAFYQNVQVFASTFPRHCRHDCG